MKSTLCFSKTIVRSIIYNSLQHDLPYLDKVMSETMRNVRTHIKSRLSVCSADYRLPHTDIAVERGTRIRIPVAGLYHNPKYFTNPYKFDPKHFSKKGVEYLPFGDGPRNYIGMRFGPLEAKLELVTILRHLEIGAAAKMSLPVKISNYMKFTKADCGIWLDCRLRVLAWGSTG